MTSEKGLRGTLTKSWMSLSTLKTSTTVARSTLLRGQRKDYFAGGVCYRIRAALARAVQTGEGLCLQRETVLGRPGHTGQEWSLEPTATFW